MHITIVFRPGPVQNLGSGFWPGRPGQVFLKSKRRRFSKKKSQRVITGFLIGSCRVTPVFSFLYFFFTLAPFQPRVGRVPGRLAGPSFKTMHVTSFCRLDGFVAECRFDLYVFRRRRRRRKQLNCFVPQFEREWHNSLSSVRFLAFVINLFSSNKKNLITISKPNAYWMISF